MGTKALKCIVLLLQICMTAIGLSCAGGNQIMSFQSLSELQKEEIMNSAEISFYCSMRNDTVCQNIIQSLEGVGFKINQMNEESGVSKGADASVTIAAGGIVRCSATIVSGTLVSIACPGDGEGVTSFRYYPLKVTLRHKAIKKSLFNDSKQIYVSGVELNHLFLESNLDGHYSPIISGFLGNFQLLEDDLKCDRSGNRRWAAYWMREIGNPKALPALESQLAVEKNAGARQAIEEAITVLK